MDDRYIYIYCTKDVKSLKVILKNFILEKHLAIDEIIYHKRSRYKRELVGGGWNFVAITMITRSASSYWGCIWKDLSKSRQAAWEYDLILSRPVSLSSAYGDPFTRPCEVGIHSPCLRDLVKLALSSKYNLSTQDRLHDAWQIFHTIH